MKQPCPHGDQPDISGLRLVCRGEILCTDETMLALLADLLQRSGLRQCAGETERPEAAQKQGSKATLHELQRSGVGDP